MSLLSTLLLVTAAALQSPSEFEDAGLTDLQTRQLTFDFGRCVVKQRAKAAGRVIVDNLGNSEIIRNHGALIDGKCLVRSWPKSSNDSVRMTLPGDMLRYSLADALIAVEFPNGMPDLAKQPALDHRPVILADYEPKPGKKVKPGQLEELARDKAKAMMFDVMARFGECVVRGNPPLAHRLILSKPGTPDERATFVGLKPTLNNCLEAGQTFKVNFAMVRGTVALNAYRLARSATAGAQR